MVIVDYFFYSITNILYNICGNGWLKPLYRIQEMKSSLLIWAILGTDSPQRDTDKHWFIISIIDYENSDWHVALMLSHCISLRWGKQSDTFRKNLLSSVIFCFETTTAFIFSKCVCPGDISKLWKKGNHSDYFRTMLHMGHDDQTHLNL